MNTTEPTDMGIPTSTAPDRHEASRPSLEQMLVEDAHFAGDLNECDNRKLLWLAMQTKAWKDTPILGKDAAILAEIESRLYPEYDGDKVKMTDWGWDVCGGEVRYVLDHAAQEQPAPPQPAPEAARIGPCLTVFWITQISPDYYRILTDQGWCDANRSEARRLVDAWYQNLNL
jgi:hypothetical protein